MLLFFYIFNFLILILFFGIIFSKINIYVDRFEFNKLDTIKGNHKIFNFKYQIVIKLLLFSVIPIFRLTINNSKVRKFKNTKMYKKFSKRKFKINRNSIKVFLNAKFKIKNLKFNLNIDTPDVIITTYITVIVSTVTSILLSYLSKMQKIVNFKYNVIPIFSNKTIIDFSLSSIITIKMVHIISILYNLNKLRGDKYERTSIGRVNDYSYE